MDSGDRLLSDYKGRSDEDCKPIEHPVPEICRNYGGAEWTRRDVTVITGERRLFVHKALLSARIPYFHDLFNSAMIECTTGEVDLSQFDSDVVESLLSYAYTGRITMTESNIQGVMQAAHYLRMDSIITECNGFASDRVRVETALPFYLLCKSFGNDDKTTETLLHYIDKHFVSISLTSEFLQLTCDELVLILLRNSLHVEEEMQVFHAISRWIDDDETRIKHATTLLRCVRFTRSVFDSGEVLSMEWVRKNPECTAVISEAKKALQIHHNEKEPSMKRPRTHTSTIVTTARSCAAYHEIIFAIGREYRNDKASLYLWNSTKKEWKKSIRLFSNFYQCGVVVLNRTITIIGGINEKTCLDLDIHDGRSDELENKFSRVRKTSDLNMSRHGFAAGAIDGKIIIAAGMSDNTVLDSAETIDPSSSSAKWKTLQSMSKRREAPASCVFDGKLYVFGGRDGRKLFNDCEYYDPVTNIWTPIASMKQRRYYSDAAVFHGKIYVAAGCAKKEKPLNTVERYDPTTNSWTNIGSLQKIRCCAYLVVSCGKLFAFGQAVDNDCAISTMEVYQPEADVWENGCLFNEFKHGVSIGVLPVSPLFDVSFS